MSKVNSIESANRCYQKLHNVTVCKNWTVLLCRVTMDSEWPPGYCPRAKAGKILCRRQQPRLPELVPVCFPAPVLVVPTPPPPPPRWHTEAGASTWGQVFCFFAHPYTFQAVGEIDRACMLQTCDKHNQVISPNPLGPWVPPLNKFR